MSARDGDDGGRGSRACRAGGARGARGARGDEDGSFTPGSADWGFYVSITPQPVTGEYYSRRGASSSQRRAAKSVSISEEGPPPDRTRSFLEPSGRKLTRDDSLHGRWAAAAV